MSQPEPPMKGIVFQRKWEKIRWEGEKRKMGIAAAIGVLSPFPFYYWLWSYPQTWVELCGKGRDPCKVMAYVSHFLKLIQFLSLFSVSTFSWPPPLYFWPLIAFGQFLNFRLVLFIDVLFVVLRHGYFPVFSFIWMCFYVLEFGFID